MKNAMKQELLNDILTGLLVAATFAAVVPGDVFAQAGGLGQAVTNAGTNVVKPALTAVTYIAYAMGSVLVVAGIAGAKKHADAPGSNPLGPAIGKLGAGAAFLAAPSIVAIMQQTGTSVSGNGNASVGSGIGF